MVPAPGSLPGAAGQAAAPVAFAASQDAVAEAILRAAAAETATAGRDLQDLFNAVIDAVVETNPAMLKTLTPLLQRQDAISQRLAQMAAVVDALAAPVQDPAAAVAPLLTMADVRDRILAGVKS